MAAGEYFVLNDSKIFLDLALTDTADDVYLNDMGLKANRQIDNDLAHIISTVPVASASITEELKGMATFYVARKFKLKNHDVDTANAYKEDYTDSITGFINRFTAIPTGRTRRQSVTKPYITEPLASDPLFD